MFSIYSTQNGKFAELQRLCWFLRRYDGEPREPLVWRQGS